ncbi:non-canonical purine NTP pyrophosphatase [Streptomyces sp. NBC_01478]|uniref:non-canonical purine NTP pyrophosphatase n=1 Tax=Streptomyces sp. NBC_01478 TaxID=2903882 RepID=UPI002E35BDF8|nr:non-canonical purine NTP pyrophosphatase [Streptomyces sp. NBC_01478]
MNKVLLASQNSIKLEEVRSVFPEVDVVRVDLLEVQSVDVRRVVEHKLEQVAALRLPVPVLVEDTGLAVEAWNGLPGALVKWFVDGLGAQGLKDAFPADGPATAIATSAVGVVFDGERAVWEGHTEGRLVDSRGGLGGWTPVFEVKDTGLTLGEMTFADRMRWTMRREPLLAARDWISKRTATAS